MKSKLYTALGLMSGTSIDGIDTALIETDGMSYVRPLAFMPHPYEPSFRQTLRGMLGRRDRDGDAAIRTFEKDLTELHADIVAKFREEIGALGSEIDVIGFHGQTIWHQPKARQTIQLGDGALLAKMSGIPVINDFRSADVEAGGNGAPLVPLYHRALAAPLPKPIAILNIGGVSNVTWIGSERDGDILAFDVGPGNALIDDWVLRHCGEVFDEGGRLAASGAVDKAVVTAALGNAFFRQPPPKSLDRDMFQNLVPDGLSAADGAATLTMITAEAVLRGLAFMPSKPERLYVAGGGRLNATLMRWIAEKGDIPVSPVDELGWSGDGLEAEAFAYLAVRSELGLPLSMPRTTGVPQPMTGGKRHQP